MFDVDMKHKYAGKIANTKEEINRKKILCSPYAKVMETVLGCDWGVSQQKE